MVREGKHGVAQVSCVDHQLQRCEGALMQREAGVAVELDVSPSVLLTEPFIAVPVGNDVCAGPSAGATRWSMLQARRTSITSSQPRASSRRRGAPF